MKRILQTATLAAVVATALALGGNASAVSVGANWVNNNGGGVQNVNADSLGSGESAGAPGYAQTNWNNLGRWGNPTTLNDSLGNSSGLDITWDAWWTLNLGGATDTPDKKLMYGYDEAHGVANIDGPPYHGFWSENQPDARVRGLSAWLAARGAASYSVVLYVEGSATDGSISEWWLQSVTLDNNDFNNMELGADLTPHIFVTDTGNFTGTYTRVPLSATNTGSAAPGYYIVFTNLTADEFVQRAEDTYATYAPRSAIQIVPEYTLPHVDVQPSQYPAGALYSGQAFSLTIVAAGPSLNYQWRKNSGNLSGQTNFVYSAPNIVTNDSGNYDVIISNSYGSVTSSVVAVTVNGDSPPSSATVTPVAPSRGVGGQVTFTVAASGTTPFTYLWRKGGTGLPGQTNATLVLGNLTPGDAGSYTCAVTNAIGGTVSSAGVLTVNAVAGTTLGINFTHGGETVTAAALGIPVAGWVNLAGANGSQSVGALAVNWASANTWHLTTPTAGDGEVFYGYLDDGNGGASVTISNLNSVFGAFVVRTAGATDYGVGLYPVTLTNGAQSLTYDVSAPSATELTDVSTVSASVYDNVIKLQGLQGDSGGVRGGLAGVILTDKPFIAAQPQGPTNTVYSGQSFALAGLDVVGVPTLAYQWRKNGSNLPGATTANYTNTASVSGDSGNYDVIITNIYGSATSAVVAVTVTNAAPFNVTVNPATAAYSVGGTVVFSVTANGSVPMTYQWYKGAAPQIGQTSPSLTLSNLTLGSAGSYTCAVTNALGGALSSAGVLSVVVSSPATLGVNFTEVGETVTATAFGVDSTNWIQVPGPNNNVTVGSVNVTCASVGTWHQGNFTPAGDNEVLYGYLDDDGAGPTVTISGLASVFPVYVVQTIGATDNGSVLQNVTINGSQILSYVAPPTNGSGGVTGQSTPSTALYADSVSIQGMAWDDQARGGLAGVIITDKPVLENQPQAPVGTIYTGGSFSLTGLNVIGVPTLSYQWRKGGTNIPGATSAVYTKSNVTAGDAGNYDVEVTNSYGSVTSSIVAVAGIVTPPNVTVSRSGNNLILNWPSGTLLEATNINGPWTTNIATSPYTNTPTAPQKFFRLQIQ